MQFLHGEILNKVTHLLALSKHFESRGDIHGIKVYRGAPTLSHMLFVDNYFLFCRIAKREVSTLTNIPETCGRVSGQMIKYQKYEIFFNSYTHSPIRHNIMSSLGVLTLIGTRKYLRLLSIIGRKKEICLWFFEGENLELH